MNKEVDNSVLAPFGRWVQRPETKWVLLVAVILIHVLQALGL